MSKKAGTIGVLIWLLISTTSGQMAREDNVAIPEVFLIGELPSAFESLTADYQEILLSVCDNDMDLAFEKWMDMLGAMEDYAAEIDYDIHGVKIYMYVFWNADGNIAHLAFYPKPTSRNVPLEELTTFFQGFIRQYKLPLSALNGFSHYASASFPISFARPDYRVRKD